jgi:hypothetical protein
MFVSKEEGAKAGCRKIVKLRIQVIGMIKLRKYGGQGTLVCVGERTNVALVGKCEGERQLRRS